MTDVDGIATTLTAERAVSLLPKPLRTTLALLHPADDDITALTLATLPRGSRRTLAAIGAIRHARSDEAADIALTHFGREVITACAMEGLPDDVARKLTAVDEELARRAASGQRTRAIAEESRLGVDS